MLCCLSVAITVHTYGRGRAMVCGFLPGLSYFRPAIPIRPLDRGTTDNAMAHFIPTAFDTIASKLIGKLGEEIMRPVSSSEPLVATYMIEADAGVVIPLVNWSGHTIEELEINVNITIPTEHIALASGQPVTPRETALGTAFLLPLDIADALFCDNAPLFKSHLNNPPIAPKSACTVSPG